MKIAVTGGFGIFRDPLILLPLALLMFVFCSGASGQETAGVNGPAQTQTKFKVVFDDKIPGVVFIESNGERIRVDTTKKTVEPAALTAAADSSSQAAATAVAVNAPTPAVKKRRDPYEFKKGEEPYDYRVVNIPTPKNVPRHTLNLIFTHRFTQPIDPLSSSAKTLFGLDSFGIASFGISVGSDASSSGTVQLLFLVMVAARTAATSAGVMSAALLPKLLRTYDATSAIHSSLFEPIGIMTSV